MKNLKQSVRRFFHDCKWMIDEETSFQEGYMRMNRTAAFLAAILLIASAMTGCNQQNESDVNSTEDTSATVQDGTENTEAATEASSPEQLYKSYLEELRICTISKGFQILEAGVVKENPNGLAGAVQFDFDQDDTEELVTFTFERNDQNGEDIRIDLLKITDGTVSLADSKYLTEMLDINTAEGESLNPIVGNSIYFADAVSMQIVSSEYEGKMYFGSLLTNEEFYEESGAMRPYLKTMNVFTIEEDSIVPCMTAGRYMKYSTVVNDEDDGVLYASLLPPSIRETTELSECTADMEMIQNNAYDIEWVTGESQKVADEVNAAVRDQGFATLFADIISPYETNYIVTGGSFDSIEAAYSAMLNEFGLELELTGTYDVDSMENTVHFVSEDQSEIRTILQMDAIRGFAWSREYSGYDYHFDGCRVQLASDLEELLNDETLFQQQFEDELALYEDILKYPLHYPEIWNLTTVNYPDLSYLVADINSDGEYELVLKTGEELNETSAYGLLTIVKPDASVLTWEFGGILTLYADGMIAWDHINSHLSSGYLNVNTGEDWEAGTWYYNAQGDMQRELVNNITGETIIGQPAYDQEEEFSSAGELELAFTEYYGQYLEEPGSFTDMIVHEISAVEHETECSTEVPEDSSEAESYVHNSANVFNGGFLANDGTDGCYRGTDGYLYLDDGTCILKKTVNYLNMQDGWIYFSNNSDSCLARIDVNAEGYEVLYEGAVHEVNVDGSWIYFGAEDGLYRMKTDGSDCTKLISGSVWYLNVTEEKLYFTLTDSGRALCSCNPDGSDLTTLIAADVYDTLILGNLIYYCYGEDRNLWAMQLDGSNQMQLTDRYARWLNTDGSDVYYTNDAGKSAEGVRYGDQIFRFSASDHAIGKSPETVTTGEVTGILFDNGVLTYSDTGYALHSVN